MMKDTAHGTIEEVETSSGVPVVHDEGLVAPDWSRADAYIMAALSVVAVLTRFWHLDQPSTLVWDEKWTVWLARSYLRNEPFRDTHPPLTALLVAGCIKLFGDQAWSWRFPSAAIGSGLVAVTYLLGRQLFNSRITATLAAALVILDGLFLVESRFAVWEIYYVTFAALAYLFLFQFIQNTNRSSQRRLLALIGASLGLALGSKFLIPAVTELLVVGSAIFAMFWIPRSGATRLENRIGIGVALKRVLGVVALVGGISTLVYMCIYLPNYWLGWWRGVIDQIASYHEEVRYQGRFVQESHQYASPWWSWPLMLRPVMFWMKKEFLFNPDAKVSSIRALGNPVIWSGVMISIPLVGTGLVTRFSFARMFLVVGYILYLATWAAIPRYHFVYHYLPSLYLGLLTLAVALSDCWSGATRVWQQSALLIATLMPLFVGLGLRDGLIVSVATAATYGFLLNYQPGFASKFVVTFFSLATILMFFYFLPLWIGTPLSRSEFAGRLWLQGPTLANWL